MVPLPLPGPYGVISSPEGKRGMGRGDTATERQYRPSRKMTHPSHLPFLPPDAGPSQGIQCCLQEELWSLVHFWKRKHIL